MTRNGTRGGIAARGPGASTGWTRRTVWAVVSLTWCAAGSAHSGTGLAGGFIPGFAHPFNGLDHLLAMVCVGLWGSFLGRPLIQTLPVAFPLLMVGGAMLGMFGVPVPAPQVGIAVSVLVSGVCIALALRAPGWLAVAIVAIFAVFHGYAHGKELPSAAAPLGYSAGFVVATGLLHVSGIGLGLLNERPRGALAIRAAGWVVCGLGGWFVYRAVGA